MSGMNNIFNFLSHFSGNDIKEKLANLESTHGNDDGVLTEDELLNALEENEAMLEVYGWSGETNNNIEDLAQKWFKKMDSIKSNASIKGTGYTENGAIGNREIDKLNEDATDTGFIKNGEWNNKDYVEGIDDYEDVLNAKNFFENEFQPYYNENKEIIDRIQGWITKFGEADFSLETYKNGSYATLESKFDNLKSIVSQRIKLENNYKQLHTDVKTYLADNESYIEKVEDFDISELKAFADNAPDEKNCTYEEFQKITSDFNTLKAKVDEIKNADSEAAKQAEESENTTQTSEVTETEITTNVQEAADAAEEEQKQAIEAITTNDIYNYIPSLDYIIKNFRFDTEEDKIKDSIRNGIIEYLKAKIPTVYSTYKNDLNDMINETTDSIFNSYKTDKNHPDLADMWASMVLEELVNNATEYAKYIVEPKDNATLKSELTIEKLTELTHGTLATMVKLYPNINTEFGIKADGSILLQCSEEGLQGLNGQTIYPNAGQGGYAAMAVTQLVYHEGNLCIYTPASGWTAERYDKYLGPDTEEVYNSLYNTIKEYIHRSIPKLEKYSDKILQKAWIMTYNYFPSGQSNNTNDFVSKVLENVYNILAAAKENDGIIQILTQHTSLRDTSLLEGTYSAQGQCTNIEYVNAPNMTEYKYDKNQILLKLQAKYSNISSSIIEEIWNNACSKAIEAMSNNSSDMPCGCATGSGNYTDATGFKGNYNAAISSASRAGDGGRADLATVFEVSLYYFDKLFYDDVLREGSVINITDKAEDTELKEKMTLIAEEFDNFKATMVKIPNWATVQSSNDEELQKILGDAIITAIKENMPNAYELLQDKLDSIYDNCYSPVMKRSPNDFIRCISVAVGNIINQFKEDLFAYDFTNSRATYKNANGKQVYIKDLVRGSETYTLDKIGFTMDEYNARYSGKKYLGEELDKLINALIEDGDYNIPALNKAKEKVMELYTKAIDNIPVESEKSDSYVEFSYEDNTYKAYTQSWYREASCGSHVNEAENTLGLDFSKSTHSPATYRVQISFSKVVQIFMSFLD